MVGARLFCAILMVGIGLYKGEAPDSSLGVNKTGSVENALVMIMEGESGFY